jgi:hypothetical protein
VRHLIGIAFGTAKIKSLSVQQNFSLVFAKYLLFASILEGNVGM